MGWRRIDGIDHVQLAMPAGGEGAAEVPLSGIERVHLADPFGNRIELLELQPAD